MTAIYFWKDKDSIQETSLAEVPEKVANFMTLSEAVNAVNFLNLRWDGNGYNEWRQLALAILREKSRLAKAKAIDPDIEEKLQYGSWSFKRKADIRARLNQPRYTGAALGIACWNLEPDSHGVRWELSNSVGDYPYRKYRIPKDIVGKQEGYVPYLALGMEGKNISLEEALQHGLLVEIRRQYQQQFRLWPQLVIEDAIMQILPDSHLRLRMKAMFAHADDVIAKPKLTANKWRHEPINYYSQLSRDKGRALATAQIHSDLVEALQAIEGSGIVPELLAYPWELPKMGTPGKPWFLLMAEAIQQGLITELINESMSRLRGS